MARTIDDLLAEARSRISRLDPLAAAKAVEAGAALMTAAQDLGATLSGSQGRAAS